MSIRVVVWSDYLCPHCYRQMTALKQLERKFGAELQIDWMAFELRPEESPDMRLHSRKAHEAADFAREQGRFSEMNEALFHAFFEEGRDIADLEVLMKIGAGIGLDPAALGFSLKQNRHSAQVSEDARTAAQLGIEGVPALLIYRADRPQEQAVLLSGVQAFEVLENVVSGMLSGKRFKKDTLMPLSGDRR